MRIRCLILLVFVAFKVSADSSGLEEFYKLPLSVSSYVYEYREASNEEINNLLSDMSRSHYFRQALYVQMASRCMEVGSGVNIIPLRNYLCEGAEADTLLEILLKNPEYITFMKVEDCKVGLDFSVSYVDFLKRQKFNWRESGRLIHLIEEAAELLNDRCVGAMEENASGVKVSKGVGVN